MAHGFKESRGKRWERARGSFLAPAQVTVIWPWSLVHLMLCCCDFCSCPPAPPPLNQDLPLNWSLEFHPEAQDVPHAILELFGASSNWWWDEVSEPLALICPSTILLPFLGLESSQDTLWKWHTNLHAKISYYYLPTPDFTSRVVQQAKLLQDFPGCPVAKNLASQGRGPGFGLWVRELDPTCYK